MTWRQYKTVPPHMWSRMLHLSYVLDLNKGGMYDGRSGCINVWASPDNYPPALRGVEITRGALIYPRSYVGGVMSTGVNLSGKVALELELTIYDRGENPETEEDWAWLTAKVDHLLTLAEFQPEPVGSDTGIYCKLCDRAVPVLILNEYLDHLARDHNITITSVTLGSPTVISTNIGPIKI